ncbi:MAG: 30S ribosomal protein S19e [Candidatus Nanoarchaeia archaeon]
MKSVYNVQKQVLGEKLAEELKNYEELKAPDWAMFVKTGANKERPPVQLDWWYKRAASILIRVWTFGPIGVSKLRVKYGGRKRRGYKPAEFRKSSGNIIRKILQQLENAELIKQDSRDTHKGRVITGKGVSLLTKTSRK